MEASSPPRRSAGALAIALLSLAACGAPGDVGRTPGAGAPGAERSQAFPSRPAASRPTQDPLVTIARHEDAASDGDGLLESLLARGSQRTRERAAFALGRLPYPEEGSAVTEALEAALADESRSVRVAAAFSIGLRGDPAAADSLLAHRGEEDATVRARIVEAASRIEDPRLRGFVLDELGDRSEAVRCEAAVGPHRWAGDAPDAARVDEALLGALAREPGGEVAWRILFTLARRKCADARAAFVRALGSDDARARLFAAQGLRGLPAEPASRDALRGALSDPDWRVVCEAALALGEHPDPEALPDLASASGHRSAHVRRCVVEVLGAFRDAVEAVRPLLERARVDESPNVRAAALVSQARLLGDEMATEVEAVAGRDDPRLRLGAARAAAGLSDGAAVPILLRLTRDGDHLVAGEAVQGLQGHPTPEARSRLVELLGDADNGLRLAAVNVLKEIGGPAELEPLGICLATSRGDVAAEIAATVLDAAARIGGEASRPILESGAALEDPFVRRKARALLERSFPDVRPPAVPAAETPTRAVPLPGEDYPLSGPNPKVEVVTNRGTMVFELLRDETPVHVHNVLELAKRGFYDGLSFHRVVPDFVIQGGDPRGDGNGAPTWRDAPLRREFTPRKYVRGSLGMPRNDDPDSGGCQIFVTHRETPHLDGRYTLFGQMTDGFEVLDAIEVGDAILRVRVLEAAGTR